MKNTPIIFHNNGPFTRGRLYSRLLEHKIFHDAAIQGRFRCPPELEIILSHNYRNKPILEKNLQYLGIEEYTVLGRDLDLWDHRQTVLMMLEHLQQHSSKPYILYLDAADILICDDPSKLLERFKREFSCKVLFNAEKKSYPWIASVKTKQSEEENRRIRMIEDFERGHYPAPFVYLNSGAFIGERKFLIEVLKKCLECVPLFETKDCIYSNQILYREVHRLFYPKVMIDAECRIFQTMVGIRFEEFKTKYPIKETEKFFCHLGYYLEYPWMALRGKVPKRK